MNPGLHLSHFCQCISRFRIKSRRCWREHRRSSAVTPKILHPSIQMCLRGGYVKYTSKLPRVSRQNLVNQCPLVHFNTFVLSGVPLYRELSEQRKREDGKHGPALSSSLLPLKKGPQIRVFLNSWQAAGKCTVDGEGCHQHCQGSTCTAITRLPIDMQCLIHFRALGWKLEGSDEIVFGSQGQCGLQGCLFAKISSWWTRAIYVK